MAFKFVLEDVASAAGASEEHVRGIVRELVSAITVRLQDGERVEVPGLGVLSTRARTERLGRNPRTGEEVTIAAGIRAKFTPGAALRRALKKPSDAS